MRNFLFVPVVLCSGPGLGRVSGGVLTIIRKRIHTRAHTRTRTGIFR